LGQKLLERESLAGWSIFMVENLTFDPRFRPFSKNSFT
jgi:hypothetical protein